MQRRYPYEVSVVVFYKRVPTPAPETERLLRAEMLPGGELVMYGTVNEVDTSLDGVKSGNWVAVMGVNRDAGTFLLKWYRLLALDEKTDTQTNHGYTIQSVNDPALVMRRAMLAGPDWPMQNSSNLNLRVAILPGVASVVTREMVFAARFAVERQLKFHLRVSVWRMWIDEGRLGSVGIESYE